jgi:integrase
MAHVFAAYQKDRERDGKQIATFRHNWNALRPTFGTLPPDIIDADLCRSYAEGRLASGVQVGTVWTELTRLRSALNWAVKRRMIPGPAPYVSIPSKPPARKRVLSTDEIERLLDGCVMPHVRLFVILALCTGGRSGALLQLAVGSAPVRSPRARSRRPRHPAPARSGALYRAGSGVIRRTVDRRAAGD